MKPKASMMEKELEGSMFYYTQIVKDKASKDSRGELKLVCKYLALKTQAPARKTFFKPYGSSLPADPVATGFSACRAAINKNPDAYNSNDELDKLYYTKLHEHTSVYVQDPSGSIYHITQPVGKDYQSDYPTRIAVSSNDTAHKYFNLSQKNAGKRLTTEREMAKEFKKKTGKKGTAAKQKSDDEIPGNQIQVKPSSPKP